MSDTLTSTATVEDDDVNLMAASLSRQASLSITPLSPHIPSSPHHSSPSPCVLCGSDPSRELAYSYMKDSFLRWSYLPSQSSISFAEAAEMRTIMALLKETVISVNSLSHAVRRIEQQVRSQFFAQFSSMNFQHAGCLTGGTRRNGQEAHENYSHG